jgi:LPXTG-motif cell wall-anchored protein
MIERKWNLPALTNRDANANDLTDMFDLGALAAVRPTFASLPALAAPGNTPAALACSQSGPGTVPPADSIVPAPAPAAPPGSGASAPSTGGSTGPASLPATGQDQMPALGAAGLLVTFAAGLRRLARAGRGMPAPQDRIEAAVGSEQTRS